MNIKRFVVTSAMVAAATGATILGGVGHASADTGWHGDGSTVCPVGQYPYQGDCYDNSLLGGGPVAPSGGVRATDDVPQPGDQIVYGVDVVRGGTVVGSVSNNRSDDTSSCSKDGGATGSTQGTHGNVCFNQSPTGQLTVTN